MYSKNFTLTTNRLTLVPFTQNESELFQEINNDPFVRKYLWDDEVIDESLTKEILSQNAKHFEEDDFGLWKMIDSENSLVIGYVGLWYFFDEPQPQLIYALLPEFTKKGFAKEASLKILCYAFEYLQFSYLIAATYEGHKESQKVAESIGMSFFETKIQDGKSTSFFRIDRD